MENSFRARDVSPAAGRLFRAEDDLRGCPAPPVVLGYAVLAERIRRPAFRHRLAPDGEDQPLEIIGVTPAGFSGPEVGPRFDLSLPLCSRTAPALRRHRPFDRRDYFWLNVMGWLKPGWTLARASEHLQAISAGMMQATEPGGYGRGSLDRYLRFRLAACRGDRRQPSARGVRPVAVAAARPHGPGAADRLRQPLEPDAGPRRRTRARIRRATGARRGPRPSDSPGADGKPAAGRRRALRSASAWPPASAGRSSVFLDTAEALHLDLALDWRMLAFTAAVASATCILLGTRARAAQRARPAGRRDQSGGRGTHHRNAPLRVSAPAGGGAGGRLADAGGGRFSVRRELPPAGHHGPRVPRRKASSRRRSICRGRDPCCGQLLDEVRATPQVESAAATTNFLIASGSWSLGTHGATRSRSSPGSAPAISPPLTRRFWRAANLPRTTAEPRPRWRWSTRLFAARYFPAPTRWAKRSARSPSRTILRPSIRSSGSSGTRAISRCRMPSRPWPTGRRASIRRDSPETMIFIRSSGAAPGGGGGGAPAHRRLASRHADAVPRLPADDFGQLTRERLLAALSGFFGGAGRAAGDHRPVRRAGLPRRAPPQRDRHPHGLGRHAPPDCRAGLQGGPRSSL